MRATSLPTRQIFSVDKMNNRHYDTVFEFSLPTRMLGCSVSESVMRFVRKHKRYEISRTQQSRHIEYVIWLEFYRSFIELPLSLLLVLFLLHTTDRSQTTIRSAVQVVTIRFRAHQHFHFQFFFCLPVGYFNIMRDLTPTHFHTLVRATNKRTRNRMSCFVCI